MITAENISNKDIDGMAIKLNDKGVNVEVQSISKKEKEIVIVLKLSDFDLEKLSIVEEYLSANKITQKEIQFFSSTE